MSQLCRRSQVSNTRKVRKTIKPSAYATKIKKKGNFTKARNLIDRLEDSFQITQSGSRNLKRFSLGHLDLTVSLADNMPKSEVTLTQVAIGSYNTIYTTNDKKYAYRINTEPIYIDNIKDIIETLDEGKTTIRLANLGIAPEVYDYYIARCTRNKKAFKIIQVTEFAKQGSLDHFMGQDAFQNHVDRIVTETVELYRRLCQNYIFCIDVKPQNMVVTNDMKIRIIDFDTGFCASKLSIYDRNMRTIIEDARKVKRSITENDVVSGFFTANLLQVAGVTKRYILPACKSKNRKHVQRFIDMLMKHVTTSGLDNANTCAHINVGAEYTIHSMLQHYIGPELESEENAVYPSYKYINRKME